MTPEPLSTLEFIWALRPSGGGRSERRYLDVVVDGVALSTLLGGDVISPFGWGAIDEQLAAIDRLIGSAAPDLAGGRVSLYVCPECGDLACGAVSVIVQDDAREVAWREFGYQNNYEGVAHRAGYESLGPFRFERQAYHRVLDELRRDVHESGP